MRRAALLVSVLGCYPSSDFEIPIREGYLSAIVLGRDAAGMFAEASPADRISIAFTAERDLELEALLYPRTLAELGVADGPQPALGMEGRAPPIAGAVLRTTITGGEFSGWDEVDASELSQQILIPFFDAGGCTTCIGADEHDNPLCKPACTSVDPQPPAEPEPPSFDPIVRPPDCPSDQVAYVGESACHALGPPCPADGWPAEVADAYVRPGGSGDGSRDSPYGSVLDAIAAGSERVALSTGTHEFDGDLDRPLVLIGACSQETIVISVLRTTAELSVRDVTIMGGVESDDRLDLRRIHLHGGPILADTASVTGSDLALHDSHLVIAGSQVTLERVFVASNLASLTCWDSEIALDDAILGDRSGYSLNVTEGCSIALSHAVLLPFDAGAVVTEGGHLTLTDAFIEGSPDGEGGVTVNVGSSATVERVMMIGDDGLVVHGMVEVNDAIIISTDGDAGTTLLANGIITGARLRLEGSKRAISGTGRAVLTDVTAEAEAFGVQVELGGEIDLTRASVSGRIRCLDSQGLLEGRDLLLHSCDTGISSSENVIAERVTIADDVVHGVVLSGGSTSVTDARIAARLFGVEVGSGQAVVQRFIIERAETGASLEEGSLAMEHGRLEQIGVGLILPSGVRPEQVLREVELREVGLLVESR